MSNCLTTNVDEYFRYNCPDYALTQGQKYFDDLFNLFYQGSTSIYIDDPNKVPFQSLLSELSQDERIGRYTSPKWLSLCNGVTFTSNRPDITRICGCFSRGRSCGKFCTSQTIPIYNSKGEFQVCFQNLCRINGLQIELHRSSLGDINISQLCTFCRSPGSCACRVDNFNIFYEDSSTGGISLGQSCDPDLSSISTQDGRDAKEVFSEAFAQPLKGNTAKIKALLLWILSILLFFFILVMLILSFRQAFGKIDVVDLSLTPGIEIIDNKNK